MPRTAARHSRRRYALGRAGAGHILLTILVAVGAYNSQNNLLFWTFGFALGLFIVSGVVSGAMLMGVSVTREPVADAQAGEEFLVRYRVRNHNRLFPPAIALSIEEIGVGADRPARSFMRRTVTDPARDRVGPIRAFVPIVAPSAQAEPWARTTAMARGPVGLTSIRVRTGFPFGFMVKTLEFDQPDEMVVTPRVIPVSSVRTISPALDVAGVVVPRPGPGDEFFALRDYIPGDAPRTVAWRASARRGSLLVRQHAAPAPRRAWVVLLVREPGASADPGDELDERAISLAAGAIESAISEGLSVGLAVPRMDVILAPHSGRAHARALHRALGSLDLTALDRRPVDALPAPALERGARLIVVRSSEEPLPGAPASQAIVIDARSTSGPTPLPERRSEAAA